MSAASASPNSFSSDLTYDGSDHAAPLSPLRDRDLQAMIELFQLKEIAAIERDVLQNLLLRCPEPYGDDRAFGFLKDY